VQATAALEAAREEADGVRAKLAEAAARESEHARRFCLIHEELAEARAELAVLHRHLDRSEALRAEITGHLFEAGTREDTDELIRLRRRALAEDQRAMVSDRTVTRLRRRVEELVSSRETLLTRIAEWQQLIREDGPEAADLSEFLAELRREILDLEHRSVTGDAREAKLRERLALAGIDPDDGPEGRGAVPDVPVESGTDPPSASKAGEADEAVGAEAVDAAGEADPTGAVDAPVAADLADAADAAVEAAHAEGAVAPPGDRPEAARESADETAEEAVPKPDTEATAEVEPPAEPGIAPAPPERAPRADDDVVDDDGAGDDGPVDHRQERTDALVAELLDARLPELRADLLLRLGRMADSGAADELRPWTKASEPSVRAAAYEALGRLLERSPGRLEPYLRAGLSDPDARVRRRVVLAAATTRELDPRGLLEPLRGDPDPQVRRLIRQVIRPLPSPTSSPEGAPGASASLPSAPNPSAPGASPSVRA